MSSIKRQIGQFFTRSVPSFASKAVTYGMDLLLPPRCASCNASVTSHGHICAVCFQDVEVIVAPSCHKCGKPFEFTDITGETWCGDCLAEEPNYHRALPAAIYDGTVKQLILQLKHSRKMMAGEPLGRLMAQKLWQTVLEDPDEMPDMIIPIPLHMRRHVSRRFNQSHVLAHYMGDFWQEFAAPEQRDNSLWTNISPQLDIHVDILERVRATKSQKGLSKNERHKNLKGAFKLSQKKKHLIKGKHIAIVDDVYTTGATAIACTKCLLGGGADKVTVITAAKVS